MTKYKAYLLIYSFSDFMNGAIVGTSGPLIPFLAANSHVVATSYYFLFISRSVASIIAAIIYKILQYYGFAINYHRVLGITSVMYVATLVFF